MLNIKYVLVTSMLSVSLLGCGGNSVESPNNDNHTPSAKNVEIKGTAKVGETLSLNYTFVDEDNDMEGKSIIVWSTPTKELQRGTSHTFKIPTSYEGDSIGAWVHPVDEHGLESTKGYAAKNNLLTIFTPEKADTTAPVITLLGKISITIEKGSIYVDAGATANDNKDGNITNKITIDNPVDTTKPGSYSIRYNVKDANSNNAIEVVRMVTVTAKPRNNHVPIATNVEIKGTAKVGETLSLNYTFVDEDNDMEGKSIIVWSTPTKELQRGTSKTFKIPAGYEGDSIGAWVHPVDEHGLESIKVYAAKNNLLIIEKAKPDNPKFGARPVKSTPLSEGDLFASPSGTGDQCTDEFPCNLKTANQKIKSGDVLFLKGGVYNNFSYTDGSNTNDYFKFNIGKAQAGTEDNPTIIESYPREWAIIDGGSLQDLETAGRSNDPYGLLRAWSSDYVYFRRLEVRNAPGTGIHLLGNYDRAEGVISHDNRGTGVSLYRGSHITVSDSTLYNNSDTIAHVGLQSPDRNGFHFPYHDGDHADGIGAGGATHAVITHNTIYNNSDDGIDTFTHSNENTYAVVSYNLVYQNGAGSKGNGKGIKLGRGGYNYAHHNIIFDNKTDGMIDNGGHNNTWKYNTSWGNGRAIQTAHDATLEGNLVAENTELGWPNGTKTNNSWDIKGQKVKFLSRTDPKAVDFLRPVPGSVFESMGAYAMATPINNNEIVPMIVIGDSTVHSQNRNFKPDDIHCKKTYTLPESCYYKIGWGDVISGLLKKPKIFFNHARSGASSKSIQVIPAYYENGFWGDGNPVFLYDNFDKTLKGAKQRINELDTSKGGFLLMQFGHNDAVVNEIIGNNIRSVPRSVYDVIAGNNPSGVSVYEDNLLEYANYAAEHNMVPVFITPVSRPLLNRKSCPDCDAQHVYKKNKRPYDDSVVNYPQALRDLVERVNTNQGNNAAEQNLSLRLKEMGKKAILLDLTKKSMDWYVSFAGKDSKKVQSTYFGDFTHFNMDGAKKIGKFMRQLACDADQNLCSQFTQSDYRSVIQTRAWGQNDTK